MRKNLGIACLLLSLALVLGGPVRSGAQSLYWEDALRLSRGAGSYPQAMLAGTGGQSRVVAVWQEYETGTQGNRAWLSLASFGDGGQQQRSRFFGPFTYGGTTPVLFSAAVSEDGTLALAVSTAPSEVTLLYSSDAGRTFTDPVVLSLPQNTVGPRVFPRAAGGWYLFLAQGSADDLSIAYLASDDGLGWTEPKPLIPAESGLRLNLLPTAEIFQDRDFVVFQSFATYQLYSMSSQDGGATWSMPERVTSFDEPVLRDRPAPDDHGNQRAHLQRLGDELWLAWERQPTGGRSQIYAARLDGDGRVVRGSVSRVTLGQGNCAEPRLFSFDGSLAVTWFDDRRGSNRVYMAAREGLLWRETDLSGRAAGSRGTFGRAVYANNGLYAFWQSGELAAASIVALIPDTTVRRPVLSPLDFTDGARIRRDRASVRWTVPADSSGILGFSWLWSRSPEAEPPLEVMLLENETRLSQLADEDGVWYFAVRAQDYAGNWSETSRVAFVRDTTPPGRPTPLGPETSADGFLSSNTFTLAWQPPDDPDVAGYAWRLDLLGPLDRLPARRRPPQTTANADSAALQAGAAGAATANPDAGQSGAGDPASPPEYAWLPRTPYEESLWQARPLPLPSPVIRGAGPRASFSNIEDGYYVFTVLAIDSVGNVGEAERFLVRADKFRPFTLVADIEDIRDDFGAISLRLFGRGFRDDGPITRIVVDGDGREPYDLEFSLADGDYRIVTDRLITDLAVPELPEGDYRIGLFHNQRLWYFTRPLLQIDVTGTVKFGPKAEPWQPSWTVPEAGAAVLHPGDFFVIAALLFSFLGLLLSSRQLVLLYRETLTIRAEARAILEGKTMPDKEKARQLKRRVGRGGLTLKFAFTISFLVLFVVALVSIPLGVQVIESQSVTLARGLEQRVLVLLESIRQGARLLLPAAQNNILTLSQLPRQKDAMPEVNYVTLTGYAAAATSSPEVVWATSGDPAILEKIDTAALELGRSVYTDQLSELLPGMITDINARTEERVAELAATLQAIAAESIALSRNLDEASQARITELSARTRELEPLLEQRFAEIADASISSLPRFDPENLGLEAQTFVFFKPVLFRQGNEPVYFRGLVRMEVSTELIVAEVLRARETLIRNVAIVAALALGAGIVGSVVLASIIINPIRRIVRGIEHIRDTEDKKLLAEFSIDIKTKDELSVLARTINEMTMGLVHAAQEAEFLTVGKEVQKMFIPLQKNSFGEKLTTGYDDRPTHAFFGYYEGAKGVSGDYFDYHQLDERYWAFIKCDVAGKGIPAALIMVGVATIFATEFQSWSYKRDGIRLDKVVYKVNDFIEQRGFKGRFAALIMGVYDSQTGAAYVCNAGDNLLRQYIAAERHIVTHELPSSPTAGTFANDLVEMKAPFQQVIKKLAIGDILLLYTDGFEESSRARRGPDFKQLMEKKIMTDREGKETVHTEPGVEQLGEERIQELAAAILSGSSYTLKKENDPLGPDAEYHFDFAGVSGTVEELVMGLAAVEKVFRMIPDPAATEDDMVMVDARIDAMLSKHFREYQRFCGQRKPHPDPRRTEYLFYTHLFEDDQYDDLTMMVIQRKS